MSRLNVLAGLLCFAGVGALTALFGADALVSTPGRVAFSGGLTGAGLLFTLAATRARVAVAGQTVDLHDCSGLGDIAVGVAILGGVTAVPTGPLGVLYLALVVAGGLSAVAFGVVGLGEKYELP